MLFWPIPIPSKSSALQSLRWILAVSFLALQASPAFSQAPQGAKESKANEIICYKSTIKEPLAFYGNPMDTFTLYEGTKWKVSSGGAHEYIPLRHQNVLLCPSEGLLVVDKRALSVMRMN
jgi:hypothetical protein